MAWFASMLLLTLPCMRRPGYTDRDTARTKKKRLARLLGIRYYPLKPAKVDKYPLSDGASSGSWLPRGAVALNARGVIPL